MLNEGTAALAPLGGGPGDEMCGYKGYGYATVVEILSSALAGGEFMKSLSGISPEGKPQMYHLGHFFFVIDPEAFMGIETFSPLQIAGIAIVIAGVILAQKSNQKHENLCQ